MCRGYDAKIDCGTRVANEVLYIRYARKNRPNFFLRLVYRAYDCDVDSYDCDFCAR